MKLYRLALLIIIILLLTLLAIFTNSSSHTLQSLKNGTASNSAASRWFLEKYDSQIPVFLAPGNYTEILSQLPDSDSRLEAEKLINNLALSAHNTPFFKNKNAVKSCAVVGKSGNLFGSGYGKSIDDNDYVFRMGSPPLHGYESDVGKRTSFHITYFVEYGSYFMHKYEKDTVTIGYYAKVTKGDNPASNLLLQKKYSSDFANAIGIMTGVLSSKRDGSTFDKSQGPSKTFIDPERVNGGILFMHPSFTDYIFYNWFTPSTTKQFSYPSTGFNTLILALHLCDSVNVYGFGANSAGEWDYYYNLNRNSSNSRPAHHQISYQEQLINQLDKNGIIKFFPGNKERKNNTH